MAVPACRCPKPGPEKSVACARERGWTPPTECACQCHQHAGHEKPRRTPAELAAGRVDVSPAVGDFLDRVGLRHTLPALRAVLESFVIEQRMDAVRIHCEAVSLSIQAEPSGPWTCFPEQAFQEIREMATAICSTRHAAAADESGHELGCSAARIAVKADLALRECLK